MRPVLYDDFDVFHDYAIGTVPAGGFWTGVHNVLNGCQDFPPVIQANGADAFGVPKPGVLFMEDTNCFMGPGGPGVGWEASRTTAPMLYREIPAAYDFYAEMKISARRRGSGRRLASSRAQRSACGRGAVRSQREFFRRNVLSRSGR